MFAWDSNVTVMTIPIVLANPIIAMNMHHNQY